MGRKGRWQREQNLLQKIRWRLLNGRCSPLLATDADCLVELIQKNLSVPNLSGISGSDNRVDCTLDGLVVENQLHFHFGKEVNIILASAEYLGMSLLTAMSADLSHGHSVHAELDEGLFHRFKSVWPNDCLNFCHKFLDSSVSIDRL